MLYFKKYFKQSIPFLLALFTYITFLIFKNNAALTEHIYARLIYPGIAYVLSHISSVFPFSIDDAFYVSLVLLLILGVGMVLVRKRSLKWFFLRFFQMLAMVYFLFYWFWGFNYLRLDAHDRIGIEKSEANKETLIEVLNLVIENTNKSYISFVGKDSVNYQAVLEPSIEQLQKTLNYNYPNGQRRVKHILFSNFFAKASILGYYGPFFNEVHVNSYLSVWDKPIVTAHEMSHQLGITSEAEANFYAWMITVHSNDQFTNYSGWLYALGFFLYQSRALTDQKEIIKKIRPEVVSDFRARREYWKNLRSEKIDEAARKVNDAYLKSNQVEKGIADYGGMVQLIIDYYLSNTNNEIFKK